MVKFTRRTNKKRPYKARARRVYRKRYHRSRVPRSMRQPIYHFIRKYQYILDPSEISGTTPNPYGWLQGQGSTSFGIESGQGIQQTFAMSLSSLVNYTEFTRLFRFHKINAIKMEFIPSATATLAGSGEETAENGPHSVNNSLILRSARNQSGYTLTNSSQVSDWLQRTGVKKQVIPANRKTTVYMKTTQTTNLSGDYPVITRSQWVPTLNYDAPFYGLDLRIDSTDGTDLATAAKYPKFTVHVTAYMSFKGTQ